MMTPSHSAANQDTLALQMRALRRRQRYVHSVQRATMLSQALTWFPQQLIHERRALPMRYALHLLVGLLVPLTIFASQAPLAVRTVAPASTNDLSPGDTPDLVISVAPLPLQPDAVEDGPVPDSAFEAIDALPVANFNPRLLKPQPIAVTVAAESANVRGGPGTNYDKVGELPGGTQLQVLAQSNGWYQARSRDGRIVWLTAELLDLDPAFTDVLPQASNIPAPPPAKVGLVTQQGLNLRDGPGTAYIGMIKLKANAQLDLLARYDDWFQVQTPDGQAGWVLGQYLAIGPGVIGRVESVTSIPDPNPALIGRTSERNVNLRGGPGTAYEKIGALGSGTQLELLGQYEDWFKVRTSEGTIGWIRYCQLNHRGELMC